MAQPDVEELCEDADPRSEVEHLVICPVCGQIFDCRDEASVAHHGPEPHAARMPA
jgi:hypothetical protein